MDIRFSIFRRKTAKNKIRASVDKGLYTYNEKSIIEWHNILYYEEDRKSFYKRIVIDGICDEKERNCKINRKRVQYVFWVVDNKQMLTLL